MGRGHQLILHHDFQGCGGCCLDRGKLSEEIPLWYSVCSGEVGAVELVEAMVSSILQTDAFVELIEPDARLVVFEGVGAFLR